MDPLRANAEMLGRLIRESGTSNRELARRAGGRVSHMAVARVRRGELKAPRWDTLVALCAVFGVDPIGSAEEQAAAEAVAAVMEPRPLYGLDAEVLRLVRGIGHKRELRQLLRRLEGLDASQLEGVLRFLGIR